MESWGLYFLFICNLEMYSSSSAPITQRIISITFMIFLVYSNNVVEADFKFICAQCFSSYPLPRDMSFASAPGLGCCWCCKYTDPGPIFARFQWLGTCQPPAHLPYTVNKASLYWLKIHLWLTHLMWKFVQLILLIFFFINDNNCFLFWLQFQ